MKKQTNLMFILLAMSEQCDTCPICYNTYGFQEDGSFLCKDGIDNSGFADETSCKHYICVQCCIQMCNGDKVRCPLCREDWTDWIHSHYSSDSDDD